MAETGTMNFITGWTGSWTEGGFIGDSWKNEFTSSDNFLVDGATIDAATFDSKFVVTNGGNTLAMIPEPATFGMLAVFGGGLLFIRRKFMT